MGKFIRKLSIAIFLLATLLPLIMQLNITKCYANQNNFVVVPRGSVIPAIATMELSSQYLSLGQNVNVITNTDFYYNNSLVVPLGSSINGTVTMVQKAEDNNENGLLKITFTNISTPYGHVIPIIGMLQTPSDDGIINGNTNQNNDIVNVAKGAAAGAIAGSAVDAATGNKHSFGRTSSIGAGIGASANMTKMLHPAVIKVGTPLSVVLNQQSSFVPVQGYQY